MIAVLMPAVIGGLLAVIGTWPWFGPYAILIGSLAAGGLAISIGFFLAYQRSRSSSKQRSRLAIAQTEIHLG
ncbi:hypothetical protein MKK63_27815 [Methylobacterium sp. J-088]|uniref:hypothetical protein n=1 Tax=unclassified Methylobacterium TaxID=2615210 RepID=UPI001FB916C9|nr:MULTISPECIES: hypothetical protein [unclassified Methylobacterium]MCJ2066472.1 hypothetical protein [Methylobacterium sp. J-088]